MLGFRAEFSPLSRLGQWYSSDMNEHPEIDSVILEYHLRQNMYYLILIAFKVRIEIYLVLLLVSDSFAARVSGNDCLVLVIPSKVVSNPTPLALLQYVAHDSQLSIPYIHSEPSSQSPSLHEPNESSQWHPSQQHSCSQVSQEAFVVFVAFCLSDKRAQFSFDVYMYPTTDYGDQRLSETSSCLVIFCATEYMMESGSLDGEANARTGSINQVPSCTLPPTMQNIWCLSILEPVSRR
jgi:hypothetical protein